MTRHYFCWLMMPLLLWGTIADPLVATSATVASSVTPTAAAARSEHGSVILENVPTAPAALEETLDGYLSGREATPLGWSPQGLLLITTRFGDVAQLHVVEAAGGERRQITFLHEPITIAAFSPDPRRSAYFFLADAGGDGRTQLYYQRTGRPGAKLLTDGKSVNEAPVWSNAGREIAFATTARDGMSHDIDVVDPEAGTLPHLVLSGDDALLTPLDWSPDDGKLLVLKTLSGSECHLFVVDLATGQKREIDPAANKGGISSARFSRDGQGVYLISNRDSDFAELRYVNLFTPERTLLSGHIHGDVLEFALSRDGHALAYVANEGDADKLTVQDLRSHVEMTVPRLPVPGIIDHLCFDADGKRLAFGYETASVPRDAYVFELATAHLAAWTKSEPGSVDTNTFVTPRLAQFPTFDHQDGAMRQVPVYVFEPTNGAPHPTLIVFHGGPEAQFRPRFDPWIQYLVAELGFAVIAPNIRGSGGYGKAYLAADDGTQRDDVIKDLGALIVWVDAQGTVFDTRRVVVAGAGYGGYLALVALANYGDRLSGAVDFGGMSDLISFLTTTAPSGQRLQRAEYGDERDPDTRAFLRRISPLTNADRIARPLLVVQGKNDPRVPLSESDQIVNRLRSHGGQVWYVEATDEGGEFRKQDNRLEYYTAFTMFLKSLH